MIIIIIIIMIIMIIIMSIDDAISNDVVNTSLGTVGYM